MCVTALALLPISSRFGTLKYTILKYLMALQLAHSLFYQQTTGTYRVLGVMRARSTRETCCREERREGTESDARAPPARMVGV